MSESEKKIFNDLHYTQTNNCDVNSISNLSQEFSFVNIRLKNKVMKKIKRMSKNLFQSNEILNIHLNIYFDFDNHDFKDKNFLDSTVNAKIIDHDISFLLTLN